MQIEDKLEKMEHKKANWSLSAVLGVAGVAAIVLPLLTEEISNWFVPLGITFIVLAFFANK